MQSGRLSFSVGLPLLCLTFSGEPDHHFITSGKSRSPWPNYTFNFSPDKKLLASTRNSSLCKWSISSFSVPANKVHPAWNPYSLLRVHIAIVHHQHESKLFHWILFKRIITLKSSENNPIHSYPFPHIHTLSRLYTLREGADHGTTYIHAAYLLPMIHHASSRVC